MCRGRSLSEWSGYAQEWRRRDAMWKEGIERGAIKVMRGCSIKRRDIEGHKGKTLGEMGEIKKVL